jgi:PKD repeat protein
MGVVVGVLSGGIVMYVSPVVDKAIKPQKPVANFSIETNNLQVTFHNQSLGGDGGFWDFGDTSALEPTTKQTEIITHTYPKAGRYTAKLMIRNFLGDENERTVQIDVRNPMSPPPKILSLQASPLNSSAIAPATFRITSETQNVQTCVWDFGRDGHPPEINSESPNHQEKLVTFDKPGRYWVWLAAINEKQADRKWVPIDVKVAPANTLMGVLSVVDEGMRMEKKRDTVKLTLWADGTAQQFEKTIPARQEFFVTDVRLVGAPPAGVRNIAILPSADRTRVTVTGEIQAAGRSAVESAMIVIPVEMSIERKVPECRPVARSTIALSVPGATSLALACCPSEWVRSRRCMILELFDGSKRLERVQIPCPETKITWQEHDYVLKGDIIGDQVTITVK